MKLRTVLGIIVVLVFAGTASFATAQDYFVKNCDELMRIATSYQQDLRTVETVLGSAIDAGTMDRIKSYQLKRGALRKELESVMRAIDLKGCVRGR
jgi:hypothetical protein